MATTDEAAAAALEGAVAQEIGRRWKWFVGAGVALALIGLVCLLAPAVTSVTIALWTGWMLIVGGIVQVGGAVGFGGRERSILGALGGILSAACGVWLVSQPLRGTFTLTIVLLWFLIAIGLVRMVEGLRARHEPGAGLAVVSGILTLLLGILIWRHLPSSAAWAIGLLTGTSLLLRGLELIAIGSAARRLA